MPTVIVTVFVWYQSVTWANSMKDGHCVQVLKM